MGIESEKETFIGKGAIQNFWFQIFSLWNSYSYWGIYQVSSRINVSFQF